MHVTRMLQIKYVSARDAGQYECQVWTSDKRRRSESNSHAFPTEKVDNFGEEGFYLNSNQTIELRCSILCSSVTLQKDVSIMIQCPLLKHLKQSKSRNICKTSKNWFVFSYHDIWKVSTVPKVSRWIDLVVVVPKVFLIVFMFVFL